MKVLTITNLYPPFYLGGYELGCKQVVDGLMERGIEVTVLTSASHARPSFTTEENHIFRYLNLTKYQPHQIGEMDPKKHKASQLTSEVSNFANTAIILETIKKDPYDCVYLFNLSGLGGGLAIIAALNCIHIPWVYHLMDRPHENLLMNTNRQTLELFTDEQFSTFERGEIISMSHTLIEEVETVSRIRFPKTPHIIPGWAKTPQAIFKRSYFKHNRVNFISSGSISQNKGIDLIMTSAARLIENHITNFNIDIYGDGDLTHYVDLSKSLGINKHLNFLGPRSQPELLEAYLQGDVFLFPTWNREPFGFAPVEAASMGCVPIITGSAGVSERLVHGVHCLKIRRDVNELYFTMRDVCLKKYSLDELGLNGQNISRTDLSFTKNLVKIIEVLKAAADKKGSHVPTWKNFNSCYLKANLVISYNS